MDIISKIESLLFITNQPFSYKKLAEILKVDAKEIATAVEQLIAMYNQPGRGISIQTIDNKVLMVTAPDNAQLVKDFIKEETTGELTRPSLETLTIIAYRGPITRAEIEKIRGVNCAVILRNLQMRGLVDSVEDKKKMSHIYSITFEFLKYLGINEPTALPNFAALNAETEIEEILKPETATEKND